MSEVFVAIPAVLASTSALSTNPDALDNLPAILVVFASMSVLKTSPDAFGNLFVSKVFMLERLEPILDMLASISALSTNPEARVVNDKAAMSAVLTSISALNTKPEAFVTRSEILDVLVAIFAVFASISD